MIKRYCKNCGEVVKRAQVNNVNINFCCKTCCIQWFAKSRVDVAKMKSDLKRKLKEIEDTKNGKY